MRACLPARGCPAITPGKFPTLIIILISQEIFKCQESADSRNALRSPRKTSVVGRRRYRMVCANAIRLYMVRSGVNDNAQRPRRIGRLAGSQNNSLRRPEGRDDVTVRYSDIGRTGLQRPSGDAGSTHTLGSLPMPGRATPWMRFAWRRLPEVRSTDVYIAFLLSTSTRPQVDASTRVWSRPENVVAMEPPERPACCYAYRR